MADPIFTVGEVLEGGDTPPPQPKQAAQKEFPPVPAPAQPSAADIPLQVKPVAAPAPVVPPPPTEAERWFAETPYAKSKSAAAAAAKGILSSALGIPQTAYHLQDAIVSKLAPEGSNLRRDTHDVAGFVDENIHDLNKWLGQWHPELSPGTELAGAFISPISNKIGNAANTIQLAKPAANIAARALAAGAANAAANPVDDVQNYWGTKLKDLGWGAGATAGLGILAKGANSAIAPQVQKAARALEAKGVDLGNLTLGQLLGGGAAKFEDWVKKLVPFSGVEAAQQKGAQEIMQTAPWREVGRAVGHQIDPHEPIQDIASKIVGGTDLDSNKVKGAISMAYDSAVKNAPLIPMTAIPNEAGDAFKKNVGTPRILNDVDREASKWVESGGPDGETAGNWIKRTLKDVDAPFSPDLSKSTHFASAEDLHSKIKYLNGRISAAYDKFKADTTNDYWQKAAQELTKVRDHLHNLWQNTDQKSFEALRNADKAHSAAQTLLEAMKAAKTRSGVPTPEDLLRAGAKGESARNVATRSVDYAPYAQNAQTVLGDAMRKASDTEKLTNLAAKVPILGSVLGTGALGYVLNSPLAAAGSALAGLGSMGASRALYGPTLNLGNKIANPSPWRQTFARQLQTVPTHLTPIVNRAVSQTE